MVEHQYGPRLLAMMVALINVKLGVTMVENIMVNPSMNSRVNGSLGFTTRNK